MSESKIRIQDMQARYAGRDQEASRRILEERDAKIRAAREARAKKALEELRRKRKEH